MATQNIEIVPAAFKSQQLPFFFGGSQVPIALIDLTQQSKMTPKKKQKITNYYKKKPKVIDLVSSKSSEPFNRLIFDTVDGKVIEGVSRYEYLPNQKQNYGRYWLVMRDVTGQLRFLWLKPKKDGKWNDHLKQFPDTGGALQFYSPEAARGKSVTFLIIDEAAFIPDMESHWKAMWPVLSTGGSCVLVSTVNGLGNWYEETYTNAKEGKNKFHVIDLDYWEHPDYNQKNNPKWADEQRAQLGGRGFLQEVLRSFLGSGETFVPAKIIAELDQELKNVQPHKKLFVKYANKDNSSEEDVNDHNKGALWIWKEPKEGNEYIISVDSAEGVGSEGDNSCVQIINTITLEQCAELYSNTVSPHDLSKIVHELGLLYNNATIVVEDMATGGIILNTLQHDLYYDNVYFSSKNGRNPKPGIKITTANRPIILQELQSRLLNKSLKVRSRRLLREMKTFEYNPATKKAEAAKGKHDDAIMSLAIALHVRNEIMRDNPLGAPSNGSGTKVDGLEDIRNELKNGLDNYIKDFIVEQEKSPEDYEQELLLSMYRKNDKILKEFGW
jgi:hypothetical protein